jgi:hypothetical protein
VIAVCSSAGTHPTKSPSRNGCTTFAGLAMPPKLSAKAA